MIRVRWRTAHAVFEQSIFEKPGNRLKLAVALFWCCSCQVFDLIKPPMTQINTESQLLRPCLSVQSVARGISDQFNMEGTN